MSRFKMMIRVVAVVAMVSGPAWAWTMYYDGFAYTPASTAADYKLGSPATYPYHVGDPTYFGNPPEGPYPPSAWVGAPSSSGVGYWPYIWPDNFAYTGLPAPTGNVAVLYGSASNNGKTSRVSLIDLKQAPPSGPYRTVYRGKLFYSMMVKVIEAPRSTQGTLGNGFFHAGFNEQPPDPTLPTPSLTRACARLRLRAGSTSIDNTFQVGVESDTGDNSTIVWDDNNTYTSGVDSTAIFVVVSYEFKDGSATDDVSSMWVNPDAATLGAASPPAYATGATSFPLTSTGGDIHFGQIASFFIREGGNSQGTGTQGVQRVVFDEVRIGTSWADVTSNVPCTAPTVAAINPAGGRAGLSLTGVQITGTGFIQGVTQVWLKAAGEPNIQGNNVDVIDSEHLVCNFNIPETAADGFRDVVVITCPESPGTLVAGFAIGTLCKDPRFDADGDTDVDMADFAVFQRCYTGDNDPSGRYDMEKCACFNADGDTDVDLTDLVAFQACAAGPGVAADPACDNPAAAP